MKSMSIYLFTPCAILLMAAAFHDGLRRRFLQNRFILAVEKRLEKWERFYWVAFALCMIVGVFVRCWQFGVLPKGLNQDGTMIGIEGFCLLRDGTDQYGTSWPTYLEAWKKMQMSPLYAWLLIPFYAIWGMSRVTLRLPILVFSLAMMPILWDLARRIAGKKYALATLFVLATNPWHIVQSRWALDAALFAHVLLLGIYLLYIGREHRLALYASMAVFGLSLYSYGVASFIMPLFLVPMAVYLVARGRVSIPDLIVCVLIFVVISGPFYLTMAINAFGWETMTLGPITMPYLSESIRTNDIAFMVEQPYPAMAANFLGWIGCMLLSMDDSLFNAPIWSQAMYRFMPVVCAVGAYSLWRRRRNALEEEKDLSDGAMQLLVWLFASVIQGLIVGSCITHNNFEYYMMILFGAYAITEAGKRLKAAGAGLLALIAVSFVALCGTYFFDEEYINQVGREFREGLEEALVDTWDWDYDRYYVTATEGAGVVSKTASVMFAHQIDYSARSEQVELTGPDGQPTDWYFTERYVFQDFSDFEPDPMECAVYIITQREKDVFSPEDFIITDYAGYAAAYPRYWAE